MVDNIIWQIGATALSFEISPERPVAAFLTPHAEMSEFSPRQQQASMLEALSLEEGRSRTQTRYSTCKLTEDLRYVLHENDDTRETKVLRIVQESRTSGLRTTTAFETYRDTEAFRAQTTYSNCGPNPITLTAASTFVLAGVDQFLGNPNSTSIFSAYTEWGAESRWSVRPLLQDDSLVRINSALHNQPGRGFIECSSSSTWSSGHFLPVAGLSNEENQRSLIWQLEAPAPWLWQLNTEYETNDWITLLLSGPTDLHHSWLRILNPGESFTTIPVSLAISINSFDEAVKRITEHRRKSRIKFDENETLPLVFNDYMNALMGDPTTEKEIPLIDAASCVGAEYYCIDCGWYDDSGDWWPSVGEWEPSTTRFGSEGLLGLVEYIRSKDMKPGLWLEPEVVGTKSPIASELPDSCFMTRKGVRITEHERYFLDFRSEEARDHLNRILKNLIENYGIEYFKLDYNVTPGTGPDSLADSPGDGLLQHVAAYLDWLRSLRTRYPYVVFEACSSGAQRMDPGILRYFDLQSTSDQQDYRLYPAIAAAAPMTIPPERAGNWAYPQSSMSEEQIAFNLVTGLSGRLYLSGNLDKLSPNQIALVKEATKLYPKITDHNSKAAPRWPLGYPEWNADVIALANSTPERTLLFLWNRGNENTSITINLPWVQNHNPGISTLFPTSTEPWNLDWNSAQTSLTVTFGTNREAARVILIEH